MLGAVERIVGCAQQLAFVPAQIILRHADADSDAFETRRVPVEIGQRIGQDQAAVANLLRIVAGHDEQEFLAAEPADHFASLQLRFEDLADLDQCHVAQFVTETIVDRLEVIDIDPCDRKCLVARFRQLHFDAQPPDNLAPVRDAREMIGFGENANFGGFGLGAFAGTLSFGSVAGFCTGYAVKKAGRAGAFVGGLGFMALTAAERSGYIAVRWDRIERDCMATLDLDSSGRVDHNDVQQAGHDFVRYMVGKNSGVTAATFTAGLLFGLRKG